MKQNSVFPTLSKQYLFQEIQTRRDAFQATNPEKKLLFLGIGDTTQPLAPSIVKSLIQTTQELGTAEKYVGYGPEVGEKQLREKIATVIYHNDFSSDEIFISDGVNSDLLRLMLLLEEGVSVAIQDPTYPAYFDTARIAKDANISFLSITDGPPDLTKAPEGSLVFLCSPNNPTGEAFTHAQYEKMVSIALARKLFIILDVAYREFIRGDFPKSIYEIEGAKKVAIEVGSFSKSSGFSGVRLGWSVVPKELCYENGSPAHSDFHRLFTAVFNGASILSQRAGLQILSPEGEKEITTQIDSYLEQAQLLREALRAKSFSVVGGDQAPYIWVKMENKTSWEGFDYFLKNLGIVVTPGIGFGPAGEGFIRLSGLARPEVISEAISRIQAM